MRVLLPAPSAVRLGRSLALPFLVAACATSAPGSGSDEGPRAQAGAAGERDLAAAGGPHAGGAGRFGEGGNAGGSGKASGGRAGGAGTPSGGNAGTGAPATCALTKAYSSKDIDCNACAEAKCCAEVNGCLDDPICDDEYVNCSLACALLPDSPEQAAIDACFADCDAQQPKGKKLYDAAIGCVEARCAAVCE